MSVMSQSQDFIHAGDERTHHESLNMTVIPL